MNVLVTGSKGFIGTNLILHLKELNFDVKTFTRSNRKKDLKHLVSNADFIVHLAAENRPKNYKDFDIVNFQLTKSICEILGSSKKKIPIIFTSSTQVEIDNAYGKSKLDAERVLEKLKLETGCQVFIYRLPGVFGKWCKPNYNSVVATFCYNISRHLPIKINDPNTELRLVYIDDVVKEFIKVLKGNRSSKHIRTVKPEYKIKLSNLANQIIAFKESRKTLITERVGTGLVRKLYSTYLSYSHPQDFAYSIASYNDDRGIFAEIIKTKDSGQVSFFTADPGVTRGGHYHHSKSEKFLVVQGKAKFGFRHLTSNQQHEMILSSNQLEIVETIPGWSHNITNIGSEKLIVVLWANEIFDRKKPDTIHHEV